MGQWGRCTAPVAPWRCVQLLPSAVHPTSLGTLHSIVMASHSNARHQVLGLVLQAS